MLFEGYSLKFPNLKRTNKISKDILLEQNEPSRRKKERSVMRNFDFLLFEENITLKEAVECQHITFRLMNEIGLSLVKNVFESGNQIHHDIKPDNIIFASGNPLLIDEDRKSEGGRGREGELRKNPTLSVYSHPQLREYWNNKGVDLYSIGLVFYYMYTGRDPEPSKGIKLDFILHSKRIEYLLEGLCCFNIEDQNEYAIRELFSTFKKSCSIDSEELDRFFLEYTCGSIFCSQALCNSEYAIDKRDIVAYVISEGFGEFFLASTYAKRYFSDIIDDYFNFRDIAIDYSSFCLFNIYHSDFFDFVFLWKSAYIASLDECNFIHLYYSIDDYSVRFMLFKYFTYCNFSPETFNNFKAYFDINEINYNLCSELQRKQWAKIYGDSLHAFFDIIYTIKISESFGSMSTTFDILTEAFFNVLQCGAPINTSNFVSYYYNILSVQFATTAIDLFDYVNYCFPEIGLKMCKSHKDIIMMELMKDFYNTKTNYLIGIKGDGECRTLKKYTNTVLNIIYDIMKEVSEDEFIRILGNRRYFYSVTQKMNIMIKPEEMCEPDLEKFKTELIRNISIQDPPEGFRDSMLYNVIFLRD